MRDPESSRLRSPAIRGIGAGRALWYAAVACLMLTVALGRATPASAETANRRVVVLYSDAVGLPASGQVDEALRQELYTTFGERLEYERDFLDLLRVTNPDYAESVARLLRSKYEGREPDLLVVMGSTALRFALGHRPELFPGVPIVYCHVEPREIADLSLPRDVVGVQNLWDFGGFVETAQRLLPRTRRVVVVLGNTPWETGVETLARRELGPSARGLAIEYWRGVAMPELERRVAGLQEGTVILYLTLYRDGAGSTFLPRTALSRLAAASAVPIFGLARNFLGLGIVGGRLIDFSALGAQTGRLAARVLSRTPAPVTSELLEFGAPRFDARELERWKIPRSRLPAGSIVEFETPPAWRQYRDQILAIAALFVVETLLVAALLVQRRRRRHAEESERRVSAIGSAIIGSLPEAVAVLDRLGNIVSVNASWMAYARARSRVEGMSVGANILARARAAETEGMRGAARALAGLEGVLSGALPSFDFDYDVDVQGVVRSFELKVVPLARAEGGAVLVIEDVTLRRQAEERFRLVVEAQGTAMVVVSAEGAIALVNPRAERIFGYERGELLGKEIESLVPERFRGGHPALRRGFVARPETRAMGSGPELFGLRKDGSEFPLEIGLSPIKSGRETLVLATIVDISERLQAEAELQRMRGEMAHFARVATLGELSAAIAHELNQPLTGILSNAQAGQRFLDAGAFDPKELQEILADVVADGRRAGEVIRRLRALLHKGPQDLSSIEVNEIVDQVVRLVAGDLALRGATLDLELADELPRIHGDRVQLQQVLLNLIINGIDAMKDCPPESRRVLVRTAPADGREVRIEIRDQGSGIPEEVKARLFEPFFSTKRDGMGMGLSIVRSIVKNHGGRIWATNNVSGGATFTVALPALASTEQQ